jgi:heterodisulfide reductase subunit A
MKRQLKNWNAEMTDKSVLVVGAGVAGLASACELAGLGAKVTIVEQSHFAGGHAIGYTCKATDQCVKCGACMVEERLEQVMRHSAITVMTGARITDADASVGFVVGLEQAPRFIDPEKCNNCGICFQQCPAPGAVLRGSSKSHSPFFAIAADKCLYRQDGDCALCREACPQAAIDLDAQAVSAQIKADAVVLATGFSPFSPESKPYGYGRFKNVITNLEMERMLRGKGRAVRPSDDRDARRIAFVQCVGSRDAKLGHLWCSKVCCGSALRMAGLVNLRQPEAEITFYYMDVQTFGRDFDTFYPKIREQVRMLRAIPADIYPAEAEGLRVTYLDHQTGDSVQETFDLVVLSVGLLPNKDIDQTASMFNVPLAETGFAPLPEQAVDLNPSGIFTVGTVSGPMSIAECIANAGMTAGQVARYLKQ